MNENGSTFAEDAAAYFRKLEENERRNGDTMRFTVDAADWLEMPDAPEKPIVEGLIEAGEAIAIVGSAKAGKSFLALQLALCIASGLPFLGNAVHQRRVLVANLEVAEAQYKRRLRRMAETMQVDTSALRGWLTIQNLKESGTNWETLRADADSVESDVIMVDPFYQIFEGEEVDEIAVQNAIQSMRRLQAADKTLITVFHAPKGFNGDRNLIDMISGSSRLARYPEAILGLMNHAEGDDLRVFSTVLRNHPPSDDLTLRLSYGAFTIEPFIAPYVETAASRKRKAEAQARRAENGADDAQAKSDEERANDLRIAISGVLYHAGDTLLTRRDILDEVRGKTSATNEMLNAMIQNGDLVEVPELEIYKGEVRNKPRRVGGRSFITTPIGAEKYKAIIEAERNSYAADLHE